MNIGLILVTVAACGGAPHAIADGRHFRLEVPPGVETQQTHLVLEGLTVPRNQPTILRAYAIAGDSSRIYLGSTAVPAVSEDSAGSTSVNVLRINVTEGLRKLRSLGGVGREVDIEVSGYGAGGIRLPATAWFIRAARLVHPSPVP